MARVKAKPSPELLTPEGARALRDRPGVADLLEANRLLSTLVAALIPGCLTGAGLAFGGESAAFALIGGGAVTLVVVALIAGFSMLLGRPIVPELFVGQNEPGELLEGVRWETEAEAAREARRRNLAGGGGYWIEVEVEPDVWGIERRGYRQPSGDGDGGGGGWDWFGGDGGGGGGDGGGG